MKNKEPKRKSKSDEPFADFEVAVSNSFAFLLNEYNFQFISRSVHIPECLIKYRNPSTGVNCTYEWSGSLSVDMVRLEEGPTGIIEGETYSVSLLILEFDPEFEFESINGIGKEPNEYVNRAAEIYAKYLRDFGSSILSGDFQLFPRLKKQAEIVLREMNLRLYGSESGETIRQ